MEISEKTSDGKVFENFAFIGFYSNRGDAYGTNNGRRVFTDDDLYKMIDAAKDALNNIPIEK